MADEKLKFPYLATIPYKVLASKSLKPAAKLHFGCLSALSRESGYCWATDEQLAEIQGVDERTVKRWNKELEEAGCIERKTINVSYRDENNRLLWKKSRKIYTACAFVESPSDRDNSDRDKKVSIVDGDKNVPINDGDKNVPYKEEISKEEISKEKEREGETPKPPTRARLKESKAKLSFGSTGCVKLTEEQHAKLSEETPGLEDLVEELNDYIESTGKVYKCHAATLRQWHRRAKKDFANIKTARNAKSNSNPSLSEAARSQYHGKF